MFGEPDHLSSKGSGFRVEGGPDHLSSKGLGFRVEGGPDHLSKGNWQRTCCLHRR
jgi:hypothetical protein